MKYTEPIYLISYKTQTNETGDINRIQEKRKVLAAVSSVRQTEFYQAQANGLKPNVTLLLRKFEYKEEKIIEYQKEEYRVLRTYYREDGIVEITIYKEVNDVSTT